MEEFRFSFEPRDNFQKDDNNNIALTELGRQYAGSSKDVAFARGQLLTGMALRVMDEVDSLDSVQRNAVKTAHLMDVVMPAAADAAQPPLSPQAREDFMAGAQFALGGNK